MAKVKAHKRSELEKFLSREELDMIFASFTYENHHNYASRNKAIWEFLLNTGLRVAECAALLISDIIGTNGKPRDVLTVRAETAKRNKSRLIPLNSIAKQAILSLIEGRNPEFNDPFITHLDGKKPLGKRALQEMIYYTVSRAGIVRKISIHCLRHTFLSGVYAKTKNLKTVQQLAGHSSASLTMSLYLHSSLDELTEAVKMLEPQEKTDA